MDINTSDLVYPLDKELPLETMTKRIHSLGNNLHAIRCYQDPDPSFKLHVLVKDNIGVSGFPTSAGCRALEDLHLPDATCIEKLRGKVDIFGKTHMSELAGFVSSVNSLSAYSELGGCGINPHGEQFLPGGSSSGSAISVAAGLCDAALGTETRGSLMIPGFLCGVYSFKPTTGAISRKGIIPLASSFDTPGILGRNVDDIQYLFELMRGQDPDDPLTYRASIVSMEVPLVPRPLRVGLLVDPDKVPEFDLGILKELDKDFIEFEIIKRPHFTNDYKKISSIEFQHDITRFLQSHVSGNMPKSFDELLTYYETHPESHPFGMDRLEEVRLYEPVEDNDFDRLVFANTEGMVTNIFDVLNGFDVLASETYIDWWSIAGAPSITVPLGIKENGQPYGLMLGQLPNRDNTLLAMAKLLSQLIAAHAEKSKTKL